MELTEERSKAVAKFMGKLITASRLHQTLWREQFNVWLESNDGLAELVQSIRANGFSMCISSDEYTAGEKVELYAGTRQSVGAGPTLQKAMINAILATIVGV